MRRGKRDTTQNISCTVVSRFPLHFMFYRGNLEITFWTVYMWKEKLYTLVHLTNKIPPFHGGPILPLVGGGGNENIRRVGEWGGEYTAGRGVGVYVYLSELPRPKNIISSTVIPNEISGIPCSQEGVSPNVFT